MDPSCCRSVRKRLRTALIWVVSSAVVCSLVLASNGVHTDQSMLPHFSLKNRVRFFFFESKKQSEIFNTILVHFKKCSVFCLNLEPDFNVFLAFWPELKRKLQAE